MGEKEEKREWRKFGLNHACLVAEVMELSQNSEEAELDCRHAAAAQIQFWSSLAARPPTSECFCSLLACSILRGRSVQPAEAEALAHVASFMQTHSRGLGFTLPPEEQREAPVVEMRDWRASDGNGANIERGKRDPGERRGQSAHISLQHHYFSRPPTSTHFKTLELKPHSQSSLSTTAHCEYVLRLSMERERICTMTVFLTPLMPFLLLFILPDGILSSACPKDCTCSTPESILCFMRRSSTFPKGVPAHTKSLYLFANGIEGLTAEDFDGLKNLEMLDLSQNKLTELPDRVFEPLISLKNLDLSSNQITHISEDCFRGMALLERLYLYSNLIKTIHPAAFNGLEHLLELKIQGNQLTSLPALSMPRLLLLDLRFNVLPSLGPSDLQTPNLESLKLGGVGLTSLNKELISGLKNLHELDISGNQLESFPAVLKETHGLIHLSLAGNPMGPLKVQDLQNLGELQELDISSLSLQGLPEEFSQLFPHLRKLTVAENPFNCLCTLAWFPRWLRAQSIILERTEETRCHFPPINAGKVLERLDHRDFGCPTTTTVTTSTVKTTTTPAVPVTTLPITTVAIPVPRASDDPTDKDSDSPLPPVPASPSSSSIDHGQDPHFCPSNTCLNGGTCRLDQHGQVECTCPHGISGMYCEVQNHHPPSPPEAAIPMATVIADVTDISSHEVTATSILLDLHRYIEMRPYIRGIRLTYRNLSGPDRRPIQLSLPATFPEYRLRGLKPNSTYTVCASPLGAPSGLDSVCTEANTAPESISGPDARVTDPRLTTMLAPAVAILLVLVLIAITVGVVCFLRRKRAKGHLDLDCEPSQLELDGVKAGLDNGALPQKQLQIMIPEPAVQNGNLEYEPSFNRERSWEVKFRTKKTEQCQDVCGVFTPTILPHSSHPPLL
ncbi:hypothetical protein INR49_018143 [Caranx melampygus]|nr:hypothetical protein INR49_018143 [Caranx melampygus]